MSVSHIADHFERSLDLLPQHWAKKPLFRGVVRATSRAMQVLENERIDAMIGSHLDTATGKALAVWGWTYGVGPKAA